MYLIHGVSKS